MSITNYGELKTHLTNYLNRSDLATHYDVFMQALEGKMYRGERAPDMVSWRRFPLRVPWMVTSNGSLSMTSGQGTFWSGYIETIAVRTDNNEELRYLPPQDFWRRTQEAGTPVYYTTEGRRIYINPTTADTISVTYYSKLTALSADSDTNTLLTDHPSIYIHGMLSEAYAFEGSHQLSGQQKALFDALVNGLTESEEEVAQSGSTLQMTATWVV